MGDLASTEAAFALKEMIEGAGWQRGMPHRWRASFLPGNRSGYVGNAAVSRISTAPSMILSDRHQPKRLEAPVLNARIRKAWLAWRQGGTACGASPTESDL